MPRIDVPSHNTHVNLPSLGEVGLKYISGGDTIKFFEMMETEGSSSELRVTKILFNQVIKPQIDFDTFNAIPENEKETLARAFLANETYFFESYTDTGDLYKDIIDAVNESQRQRIKDFQKLVSPSLLSAQKQIAEFVNRQLPVNDSFVRALSQSDSLFAQISKIELPDLSAITKATLAMSPVMPQLDSITRSYAAALNANADAIRRITNSTGWINQVASYQNKLTEVFKNYGITAKDSTKILRKYKWFISSNTPASMIYKIKRLDGKPRRQDKAVNKIFVDYFKQDRWRGIEAMAADWKDSRYLKSRYKIIIDCVVSMRTCDPKVNISNVVLPTLIVQIDGIINDYLRDNGQPPMGYNRRNNHLRENPIPVELSNELNEAAKDVFLEVLFKNTLDEDNNPVEIPLNFNRHKILHAEFIQYGKEPYLIRAFMLLDILAKLR